MAPSAKALLRRRARRVLAGERAGCLKHLRGIELWAARIGFGWIGLRRSLGEG